MLLEIRAVAPFLKNGFLLGCERTRVAAIVDPGDEVGELIDIVRSRDLRVSAILLTHAHVDHLSGVAKAKAEFGSPIYLHEADAFLYRMAVVQGEFFGLHIDAPPPVDRFYDLLQPIELGDLTIRVHHVPGHSPGSVCLQAGGATDRPRLFVGDALFEGSIGRTDLLGGSYDTLIHSIKEVLLTFDDETEVYPGHGPATTIGKERRTNPFLQG
jgi:glyoxylase-like metal-dependent hydrolase (beta-lactamase superfamily II)